MEGREPIIEPEVVSWEMAAVLRKMTPAEKFECMQAMWRLGRITALADLRSRNPDWSESRISQELARRVAGDEQWVPRISTEMVHSFFRSRGG